MCWLPITYTMAHVDVGVGNTATEVRNPFTYFEGPVRRITTLDYQGKHSGGRSGLEVGSRRD